MKRTVFLTAIALMIATAAPSSFAAGINASTTNNPSPDALVIGSTTNACAESLITAVSDDATNATSIKEMADISSLTVIKVSDGDTGNDLQTVNDALTKNKANIATLYAAIAANSQLKAKLDEKSIRPSSVVALNVVIGGVVTAFVE